jgi:hypothetical protein
MLHRLLNLCELIGPMAIRPSAVHMCVQSHPLNNYLTKCDEIYMTFYQLVVQMVSVAIGDTYTQIIDFEIRQCLKTLLVSNQKHSNQIMIMASFWMLLCWINDYFVIIKFKLVFSYFLLYILYSSFHVSEKENNIESYKV